MSASMADIDASITEITGLISEIAEFMEKVERSAESSDKNSAAVMEQMQELFRLSALLNQTVASFRI